MFSISIGTTGKGIGPTYSSKASRVGLRIHHLYHFEQFEEKYRTNVANKFKRFGDFELDLQKELEDLKVLLSLSVFLSLLLPLLLMFGSLLFATTSAMLRISGPW